MNQDKIKELAKFVKEFEGKDEFKKKAIGKYKEDFDFLIEIIEKKSSEMPAMSSEYAMMVLDVLVKDIEMNEKTFSSETYDTKIAAMGNIVEALEKSQERCNANSFIEMIIDNGCAYYQGSTWWNLRIFEYLISVDLSEKQISDMLYNKPGTTKHISRYAVRALCSFVEKISDNDLNLFMYKLLQNSSDYQAEIRIIQEEKMWRRKQKKEVKDEPG